LEIHRVSALSRPPIIVDLIEMIIASSSLPELILNARLEIA